MERGQITAKSWTAFDYKTSNSQKNQVNSKQEMKSLIRESHLVGNYASSDDHFDESKPNSKTEICRNWHRNQPKNSSKENAFHINRKTEFTFLQKHNYNQMYQNNIA